MRASIILLISLQHDSEVIIFLQFKHALSYVKLSNGYVIVNEIGETLNGIFLSF